MKKNKNSVLYAVIATGISSVTTQLLTIREFLAIFSGNEFVIAMILFNWLVAGGLGSLLARLFEDKTDLFHSPRSVLGAMTLILSILPVLQIIAIRILHDVFFIYGTSTGFYQTFAFTFMTTMPYACFVGFVLPFSLFVLRTIEKDYQGAWIYITDNAGDVAGGALFSFILVNIATPMQALLISGLPLCAAGLYLFDQKKRLILIAGASITLVILLMGPLIEKMSLEPPYGELVHYRESKYGRIIVQKDQDQFTLFSNGAPTFTSGNLASAEETIHYPFSQTGNINHVLVISAESGIMPQIHKYSPISVDYIEIDPEVTSTLLEFELIKKIPELNIIHQDARAYLNKTDKIYDAILLNLPEPETFQINRFYTDSFFKTVLKHLSKNGIFSFTMNGFDNVLTKSQQKKISSLYNTASVYFKEILLIPGQKIYFLCGNKSLNGDIPKLLAEKKISTQYISAYFYGDISSFRLDYLNSIPDPSVIKNTDTKPNLIKIMFSQWFSKYKSSPLLFSITLTILLILFLLRSSKEEFLLFTTGFTTMGSEILVIFSFQIFFGYIYYQIGLIVTVFLAGLLPGAWFAVKHIKPGTEKSILIMTDLFIAMVIILFVASLHIEHMKTTIGFYLLFGFMVSLLCGFQFPIVLSSQGDDKKTATRAFSADLMGAGFGVLITSVILLPNLGLHTTAISLACLKLFSMFLLLGFTNK